ncbi:MAG: polyhydroxyalkanoic acid system family protein [Betaproteobacteria bacterium]|nr:polyhydroxyalkanoic acid system family protein [Betaproteobacteria bacterium]
MADIALKRTHHLGLKGARAAAEKMAEKLGKQFNLSGDWTGNTLHFDRPGVNGSLTVSETDMQLAVTLGFLLKAMKGPIEKAVHEQLDKVLAEAPAPRKAAEKPTPKPAVKATAKATPKTAAKPQAKTTAKKK